MAAIRACRYMLVLCAQAGMSYYPIDLISRTNVFSAIVILLARIRLAGIKPTAKV